MKIQLTIQKREHCIVLDESFSTMLARSALLRRLSQRATAVRGFHASPLASDALDMVDTFARRHSKSTVVSGRVILARLVESRRNHFSLLICRLYFSNADVVEAS